MRELWLFVSASGIEINKKSTSHTFTQRPQPHCTHIPQLKPAVFTVHQSMMCEYFSFFSLLDGKRIHTDTKERKASHIIKIKWFEFFSCVAKPFACPSAYGLYSRPDHNESLFRWIFAWIYASCCPSARHSHKSQIQNAIGFIRKIFHFTTSITSRSFLLRLQCMSITFTTTVQRQVFCSLFRWACDHFRWTRKKNGVVVSSLS